MITTFEDNLFGTFVLDPAVNWFESKTEWGNAPVQLALEMNDCDDAKIPLATAKKLWEDQAAWAKKIAGFAIAQLLELKNDVWLEEDEAEITSAQFIEKMRLRSITVYPDGEFEFWHNDGDLFWGHTILISGNLIEGVNYADIPG